MSKPSRSGVNTNIPFFRGLTVFKTDNVISSYPFPDIGDDSVHSNRIELGPEVSFAQPSVTTIDGRVIMAMPTYSNPNLNVLIHSNVVLPTNSQNRYLINFELNPDYISPYGNGFFQLDNQLLRTQIRQKYVKLNDGLSEKTFVLIPQEYRGSVDSSIGKSTLDLYDTNFTALTFSDISSPTFQGGDNHCWSIATGNVDGPEYNYRLPYYPNNKGNEIIVTQSTKEFVVANSRLMIIRYLDPQNGITPKVSPPGQNLKPFDTICTLRINGWLAAVNDLNADGKDEIILVDGSIIKVLRLRDYTASQFGSGDWFETLFTYNFPNETISAVAVSDLEGDGKNDLIITTNNKTYVIGTTLKSVLSINYPPKDGNVAIDYCVGDTVDLKWSNLMKSSEKVKVYFQQIAPKDTLTLLDSNYSNSSNIVNFPFILSKSYSGIEGRFIVVSLNDAEVCDTSGLIRIAKPKLTLNPVAIPSFYVGDVLQISGVTLCIDSLEIQYRLDSAAWQTVSAERIKSNGDFSLSFKIPCLNIFEGAKKDKDIYAYFRAVSFNPIYADTTDTIAVNVKAKPFPIYYDTCTTACPTILFTWKESEILFPSDTLQVVLTLDTSYTLVAEVPSKDEKYLWNVPIQLNDSTRLRFWTKGACSRIDTLVKALQPKYIEIVAPNPFDPTENQLEIVYKTPSTTSVDIKIYDQNNQIVRTLISGVERSEGIAYCERWDGKTLSGAYAANGMYYIVLSFGAGGREVYPAFIKR